VVAIKVSAGIMGHLRMIGYNYTQEATIQLQTLAKNWSTTVESLTKKLESQHNLSVRACKASQPHQCTQ